MTGEHRRNKTWMTIMMIAMAAIALGLIGVGATRFQTVEGVMLISAGALGLLIVLGVAAISLTSGRT